MKRICERLGIEPRFEDWPNGEDPAAYVVSKNLHRRHLSESQRAMVAGKIANMPSGTRTDLEPSANSQKVSTKDAAEMLNVGERGVYCAKTVLRDGTPEEIAAVESGDAAVSNADWRKSIESIIQTGRDLIQAKADLPNGQFEGMVKNDLDFSCRTARNLMHVARHPSITDRTRGSDLPRGWTVLRTLAQLSKEDFDWAREHNLISEDMSRGAATAIRKARTEPGKGVVTGGHQRDLPKPSEARDIARETGRMVAAHFFDAGPCRPVPT